MKRTIALLVVLIVPAIGLCQEEPKSVQEVAAQARDSIVVVTNEDRQGKESGLGTGFVIDSAGLIATSLHVIGEARPIWIQTRDGKRYEVIEVFASDRTLDLAIVRVQLDRKLPTLSLAEEELLDGQPVVAIGHPLGLKNSVVSGRVAGDQQIRGAAMWQLEMTIEPGISGGPLLDMHGEVHGIVVMKSLMVDAFGFAVKAAQLRMLMEHPNPISIERWKTIGQIDQNRWQAKMGARWRQRNGRLLVAGAGKGFGGRSLLLRTDAPPAVPFELSVMVKLGNETGAAGLVFHSDDGDRHYGFYPSNGRLRLTSFEGPTVFSWNVIGEVESENYKPGDWNEIKVRVEKNKVIGYVNDHEVMKVDKVRQEAGRIGLCKFRDTEAEFRRFRFAPKLQSEALSKEKSASLESELASLAPRADLTDADLIRHSGDLQQRMTFLEDQARELAQKADELRQLSQDIHVASVAAELRSLGQKDIEAEIDLLIGALLIAKLDNHELDVQSYVDKVDDMAPTIQRQFKQGMSEASRLAAMDDYLFKQNGFHGGRTDYYNAANSHLDQVIDDREGLPITLSVLYISLAKRLGLNVVGVGLPGHFVVRHEPKEGTPQLVDVFDRGKRLTRSEATAMVRGSTGRSPRADAFESAEQREILLRMLRNLRGSAERQDEPAAMLRYLEGMVAVDPDNAVWRGTRGVLRHRQGRTRAALDDLDWIIEQKPAGIDLKQVRRMRDVFAK